MNEYLQTHNLVEFMDNDGNRKYQAFDFFQFLKDNRLKLKYIKSGSTGHCFKAFNQKESFAIKLVGYQTNHQEKYGNIYNKERPENVELYILKNLNEINGFDHITKLYGSFYTEISFFKELKNENKKIEEFTEKIAKFEFDPICSVIISEYCELGDLQEYIRIHKEDMDSTFLKVLFFQILVTLLIIHDHCDSFKHNDLKCNNILLQKSDPSFTHFYYKIGEIDFRIPNLGFIIKLWDFDFSTGICSNLKVKQNWANKLNINEVKNLYYDTHFFFHSLIQKSIFPELTDRQASKYTEEIYDFIDYVIPKFYRTYERKKNKKKNLRLSHNHEHITPLYLIQIHSFFNDFKVDTNLD
jgi:serine/threonine protein kinase